MNPTEREIVRLLHKHKKPLSQNQIASEIGVHRNTVYRALRSLSGVLVAQGPGGRMANQYRVNYDLLPPALRDELLND